MLHKLKFITPTDNVYVENDATAYSMTKDLVDSYSSMPNWEDILESRYKKRIERILASYRKQCIDRDNLELKVSIINGQVVYTVFEHTNQTVKTIVRDQLFNRPRNRGKPSESQHMASNPRSLALSGGPVALSPMGQGIFTLSSPDPPTTYSRRRSSSVTYRLNLNADSDDDLTCAALLPDSDNDDRPLPAPYFQGKTPNESRFAIAQGPELDQSNLHSASSSAPAHPATQQAKQSAYDIYKIRMRQFRLYNDEKHTGTRVRKAVPSLSNIFPQAVFPPLTLYSDNRLV